MNTAIKLIERGSTVLLRATIVFIGLTVLVICIFALPAGLSSDQTGFYKPILAGLYIPAIPFYFALYQAMRLLNLIDKNKAFNNGSIQALNNIKY